MTGCISTAPCLVGKARSLLSSPSSPFDPPHATCGAIITKPQTAHHMVNGMGARCGSPREKKSDRPPIAGFGGAGEWRGEAIGQSPRTNARLGPAARVCWQLAAGKPLVSRFGSGWQRVFSASEAAIQALLAMLPLRYRQEQCDVMRSGAPRPLFLSISVHCAGGVSTSAAHLGRDKPSAARHSGRRCKTQAAKQGKLELVGGWHE